MGFISNGPLDLEEAYLEDYGFRGAERFLGAADGMVWYEVDGRRRELGTLGYLWWEGGAECRDLARDILELVLGSKIAHRLEGEYCREVISKLDPMGWEMTNDQVREWARKR